MYTPQNEGLLNRNKEQGKHLIIDSFNFFFLLD